MSSDYYGFIAGEVADAGRQKALNEQLQSLVVLRRYGSALEYADDFEREWRATMRDPLGRAALTLAYQQAQAAGQDAGGEQCCGTTVDWHRPWCETGPRRYREQEQDEAGYSCCGGYMEHRYRCANRAWPATATPEVRRTAVRGDCIAPAHAQIEDLVRGGMDYQQRKRLTEILSGIWDDGCGYGRRITADDGQVAEGTVRDD